MNRRGLALVLVVGVLAVLSVLGSAFAVLSRIERKAAAQRVQATQAWLLARSGIEDGLARMELGQRAAGYAGTFGPRAGYAVQVEDESGKINVNGGLIDGLDRDQDSIPDCQDPLVTGTSGTSIGWNPQLVRVLDVLGTLPEVGEPDLGTRMIQNRPPGGYASIQDLQAAIGSSKDLSSCLTVASWSDPKVVHPNGIEISPEGWDLWEWDAFADVKKARTTLRLEEGGRPPVNLNAAPWSVLVALMSGLSAVPVSEPMIPDTVTLPQTLASNVATQILFRRALRPFSDWSDFQGFLDSLLGTAITGGQNVCNLGGNAGRADLLKANFNPNTQSMKEMPDQIRWLWFDKTDLECYSTEGSLGPTGIFRLASEGQVTAEGRLLARASLDATVELFRLCRQSTQADFVGGRPQLEEYLSLSSGLEPTTGSSASAAWWGGSQPGAGLAVTTYPCPPPAVAAGRAAEFDGYLGLASVEHAPVDPEEGTLLFLHHFDDGWDADWGAAGSRLDRQVPGVDDRDLQTSVSESVWPAPSIEPNTLYPDGFHAQRWHSPAYLARPNFPVSTQAADSYPSDHGVFSYWVKRLSIASTQSYAPVAEHAIDFSCVQIHCNSLAQGLGNNPGTATLMVGEGGPWGLQIENIVRVPDDDAADPSLVRERMSSAWPSLYTLEPGMRWHLVTAFFDTDSSRGWDARYWARAACRDGIGTDPAAYAFNLEHDLAESLFDTKLVYDPDQHLDVPWPILFTLGRTAPSGPTNPPPEMGFRVSQVMDELAICDFTDDALAALPRAEQWASDRFKDGRYYKGDDAAFLSAPVRPAGAIPVRLLRASWTALLPREDRKEMRANALFGNLQAPQDRGADPYLQNARVEVELLDEATTDVQNGGVIQGLDQGGPIGLCLRGFRYRVRLKPMLSNPLEDPVLETPMFDDITFAFQTAGGPRVLAWGRP